MLVAVKLVLASKQFLTEQTVRQVVKLDAGGPDGGLQGIQIGMDLVVGDYLLLEVDPEMRQ